MSAFSNFTPVDTPLPGSTFKIDRKLVTKMLMHPKISSGRSPVTIVVRFFLQHLLTSKAVTRPRNAEAVARMMICFSLAQRKTDYPDFHGLPNDKVLMLLGQAVNLPIPELSSDGEAAEMELELTAAVGVDANPGDNGGDDGGSGAAYEERPMRRMERPTQAQLSQLQQTDEYFAKAFFWSETENHNLWPTEVRTRQSFIEAGIPLEEAVAASPCMVWSRLMINGHDQFRISESFGRTFGEISPKVRLHECSYGHHRRGTNYFAACMLLVHDPQVMPPYSLACQITPRPSSNPFLRSPSPCPSHSFFPRGSRRGCMWPYVDGRRTEQQQQKL